MCSHTTLSVCPIFQKLSTIGLPGQSWVQHSPCRYFRFDQNKCDHWEGQQEATMCFVLWHRGRSQVWQFFRYPHKCCPMLTKLGTDNLQMKPLKSYETDSFKCLSGIANRNRRSASKQEVGSFLRKSFNRFTPNLLYVLRTLFWRYFLVIWSAWPPHCCLQL